MAATRRWAAAVGVVLALLTVAGPASAKTTAQGRNAAQTVGTARWQVVIVSGTAPATAPAPPAMFDASVLTPTYLTLTNIGSVTPGTMAVTANVGLNLLGGVFVCRVPWVNGNCSQQFYPSSFVFTAGSSNPPPVPNETWYLKVVGALVVGATMSAVTTAPANRALNS